MKVRILVVLLLFIIPSVRAQGLLDRLKRKAEEIGEKVIDKTVDDALNGKKQHPGLPPKPGTETSPQKSPPAAKSPESLPVPTGADITISASNTMILTDTIVNGTDTLYHFNTSSIQPKEFITYALSLRGTPYMYSSSDPAYGLDCSGLITHVFNHFNIQVPRRTFDFRNAEKKVPLKEARPGDLVLFTGSDPMKKTPGHMGIVTAKGKDLEFVHASSGKAGSVTTSLLSNSYFKARYLEIVRVFN